MQIEIDRRIRWYQRSLHEYLVNGGRRALAVWHRRAGKDEIALYSTCELAHKRIGSYWHCLPEYEQARKALWTSVNPHTGRRRIDEAFPPELREAKDEHAMFIRLKSGSTWQLIGSDRYDATVGASPVGIVYSEWALGNPSAWAYHKPMLRENKGWAAFITTPRGRNHVKRQLDSWSQRPGYFTEVLTVEQTHALTKEELAEELADYVDMYGEDAGRAYFEQEYFCSFNAAILGAFYAREMLALRSEGRILEFEAFPAPVHRAWDIGVKDDTSIWWFQVVGKRLLILDCYTASGVGVDHYAEVCVSKPWPVGRDYVPHDAFERQWVLPDAKLLVDQMAAYGINRRENIRMVPRVGKQNGITAARRALKRAVFHARCEDPGISALEQYRREWDDDKKAFRANEVHDWTSHLADAWRYLAVAWQGAPAPEPERAKPQPVGTVVLDGPPKARTGTRITL